jgi:hypothetical protein
MNATKKIITYIANPYDTKRDHPKKGSILNKTGRIVKNDYLKFDMTSQRGYK